MRPNPVQRFLLRRIYWYPNLNIALSSGILDLNASVQHRILFLEVIMTKPPFIYKVKWEGQGGTRHIKNLVFAPIDFSVLKSDERLLKASNEIHELEKSAKTWEDCLEGAVDILKKYGFVRVEP